MKITLKTSQLFETLLILENETRCEITAQSNDLILIEACQDRVSFTTGTKYSSLCRTFRIPESDCKETCLVGLKELIRTVEKFSKTTAVCLILSQRNLIVKSRHYSPVHISCCYLSFWPHKTIRLRHIFQLPEKFPVWLRRFVSDGDTIATQRSKICLTSQGIIASREKVFLHIPFDCSIRTPVFLPPPPVFFEGAPDKPTFISKGVVTGHEAKERSVVIALESFSWRWIIYKPSEWIAGQILKVPAWNRELLCSIQLSDAALRQCCEFTKQYQREFLEWSVMPQEICGTFIDNALKISPKVRMANPPTGISFHLPSEMLAFMKLMNMNQLFVCNRNLIAGSNHGFLYWKG